MERPRIGLVVRGGANTTTWSGTPAGLLRGLEACGYQVVVCDAEISMGGYRLLRSYLRATSRPKEEWFVAPEMMMMRGLTARWRRRHLAPVGGWIVLGSEFALPVNGPYVTLDDMTVAQARQHPWYFQHLPTRSWDRWQTRQEKLYQGATRCFAASSWAAASMSRDYGLSQDKVEVVGLGRNLDTTVPTRRDWSVPRFLFVGADWDRKNGRAVLEGFAHVRQQFPSAELSVEGKHPRLELPGVHDHGRLKVDRPEDREVLTRLFAESTCLVMPSFLEPFGIVYAEAAAAGLAVIGTTRGAAPEVVGPAGVCVDPTDGEAIASAMRTMADPAVAMRYGSAGPAHAQQYTWVNTARRIAGAFPRFQVYDKTSMSNARPEAAVDPH